MGLTGLHAGHALTDALDDGAGLVAKDAGELAAHGHHKGEKGDTSHTRDTPTFLASVTRRTGVSNNSAAAVFVPLPLGVLARERVH